MLKVYVFFYHTYLLLMHKCIYISALLYESRSQIFCLFRSKIAQYIENYEYEIVCLSNLAFLALNAHNGSHQLIHYPLNCDDFENRARDISNLLDSLHTLLEGFTSS